MAVLKLLVRVAFICNICFLLTTLVLLIPDPPQGGVVSTAIVMGWIVGLAVNASVVIGALVLLVRGGWRSAAVSPWLMGFNFVVFFVEFVLFFLMSRMH